MDAGGCSPSVRDRVMAARIGAAAVDALLEGQSDVMIGIKNHETTSVPLEYTWTEEKAVPAYLVELAGLLV